MSEIKFVKSKSLKVFSFALTIAIFSYFIHSHQSINSKARSVQFPGMTHIRFDRSARDLILQEIESEPTIALIKNLNEIQIKPVSSIFTDKKSNLMVFIGEKIIDRQLIFAVIKNNQITQIQKINEISDKSIDLQYGKIIFNSKDSLASTHSNFDEL